MRISIRPAKIDDLVPALADLRYTYGPSEELHRRLPEVWGEFLTMESVWAIVVESPEGILVHSMTAFVSDHFVEDILREDRPFVAARIVERFLESGEEPISLAQMREAQQGDGLNLVTMHSLHARAAKGENSGGELGERLAQANFYAMRGFRFQSSMREVFSAQALNSYVSGGWRIRSKYGAKDDDPELDHPFLLGFNRQEALANPGARMSTLFVDYPAYLGLKRVHRELLEQALAGLTDDEMADALSLSASAVKKRWRSVYDRVDERAPDLLPSPEIGRAESSRGQERRRHLLNYLRDHPEEMRPWED